MDERIVERVTAEREPASLKSAELELDTELLVRDRDSDL